MKIHLNYSIENSYGGYTTGTLCGLENKKSTDGTNSTDKKEHVTCLKCLKILNNPNHWRYRKLLVNKKSYLQKTGRILRKFYDKTLFLDHGIMEYKL